MLLTFLNRCSRQRRALIGSAEEALIHSGMQIVYLQTISYALSIP